MMPVDKAAERHHFDRLAETTAETWWGSATPAGIKRLERRAHFIAQALSKFSDPAVLELGCGTGALSGLLLREMPGLRLTACDISPKAVEIAAQRYGSDGRARFEV